MSYHKMILNGCSFVMIYKSMLVTRFCWVNQ